MSRTSEAARLALVTTVGLALAVTLALTAGGVSLSSLITPGGLGPSAEVVAEDFGADAVDPVLTGYDGQQVYAIAREFPDLDAAAESLDRPTYRMLRVLVPAVASVAPAGEPTVIALLALNVAGLGIAVYAGARILESCGGRAAMAVPAAAVLLLGVATSTVEPVAWGLTMVGLRFALQERHRAALLVLVLAALSRETAAVAAAGIGAGLWLDGTPLRRAVLYGVPGLTVLAWYGVLSQLIDDAAIPRRSELLGFLSLSTRDAAIAAAVAGLGIFATAVWWPVKAVALPALLFTGWMAVYTVDVLDPIALLRVNGLAVLLGVLGVGRLWAPRAATQQLADGVV